MIGEKVIWAKSSGTTLFEHTKEVLESIQKLKESGLFSNLPDEWWKVLFYAALFHDLGKIDPVFQMVTLKNNKYNICKNSKSSCNEERFPLPHNLLSLFFIDFSKLDFPGEKKDSMLRVLRSAVAFHHWRERFASDFLSSSGSSYNTRAENITNCRDKYEEILHQIRDEFKELEKEFDLDLSAVALNKNLLEYVSSNGLYESGTLIPPYGLIFLPERLKQKMDSDEEELRMRIFVAGSLMRADHYASYLDNINNKKTLHSIEIGGWLSYAEWEKRIADKFKQTNCWQHLLIKEEQLQNKNCILIAPTGVGKTEFACLWGAGNKMIMMLPMRVMTNALFMRLLDLTKKGSASNTKIALLHSDAALILRRIEKERGSDAEENIEGDSRTTIEMARHLAYPYILCTADQIAPAALRYPGYERIFSVLMASGLVVDEIQAYDPRAAAIVTFLAQQTMRLGGKVLVMTATLPGFIKEALTANSEETTAPKFIDLLKKGNSEWALSCKHSVRIDSLDDRLIEQMVYQAQGGKKVIVVANTVKKALQLYNQVINKVNANGFDLTCMLIHSRYTLSDRQNKERKAFEIMPNSPERPPGGAIIVSTQIVEASLDLDADIIYTEAAPADSLIQRMGRVYRRYARSTGFNAPVEGANVVVFLSGEEELASGVKAISSIGSSGVYDFMLTLVSLIVLGVLDETKKEKGEDSVVDKHSVYERSLEILAELIPKKDKKEKRSEVMKTLVRGFITRSPKNSVNKPLFLKENEKSLWVEVVYDILEILSNSDKKDTILQDGKNVEKIKHHVEKIADLRAELCTYKRIYDDTLKILENGYCSESHDDAQKLFRHVTDLSIVPEERKEAFKEAVIKCQQSDINYIELQDKVLSEYVVNIPRYMIDRDKNLIPVKEIVDEIRERLNLKESKDYERLKKWLTGIYFAPISYSSEVGAGLSEGGD